MYIYDIEEMKIVQTFWWWHENYLNIQRSKMMPLVNKRWHLLFSELRLFWWDDHACHYLNG